jgi:methionyl aminopeptidase
VIERMRAAGKIARDVLAETGAAVAVGVTTDELDRVAHAAHVSRGVYPSPLRYRGFPKSVCTSVNEVICHGIPDDRALVDGDIVNLDITVYVDGVGDTNATFCAGRATRVPPPVKATEECLTWASMRCAPLHLSPTSGAPSRNTPTPTTCSW